MHIPFRLQTLVATMGLAGAALLGQAHAADSIKIAMVIPATGPLTQYGDMVKKALPLLLRQINAAGGINGKIETTVVDDACEPKQGPVAANRVVNDKIRYVIGPVCSGAAIAAAPIYSNEGVVVITPSATSPALTEGKNFHFIFRTVAAMTSKGQRLPSSSSTKPSPKSGRAARQTIVWPGHCRLGAR